MTASSRLAILARVRQAQVRAYIPETQEGLPKKLAYPPTTPEGRQARLLEEFKLLGVEAHVESSAAGVRERLATILGSQSILSWDPERLPYGAGETLRGRTVYSGRDPKAEQGKAEIGLTGCESVLAETGSLAMVSGPGRPRAASLMPMTHVVLIKPEDIVQGMGEFFARFGQSPELPYLVFITGPSRTADIELSLTLGVHGPGRVIAILGP